MERIDPIGRILVPRKFISSAIKVYPGIVTLPIENPTSCSRCSLPFCAHQFIRVTILGGDGESLLCAISDVDEWAREDAELGNEEAEVTEWKPFREMQAPSKLDASHNLSSDPITTDAGEEPSGTQLSEPMTKKNSHNGRKAQKQFGGVNYRRRHSKGQSKKPSPPIFCKFCRSNRETEEFYTGHCLERNGVITCPILRAFTCPVCQATGDFAHTLKYCPTRQPNTHVYMAVVNAFGERRIHKY